MGFQELFRSTAARFAAHTAEWPYTPLRVDWTPDPPAFTLHPLGNAGTTPTGENNRHESHMEPIFDRVESTLKIISRAKATCTMEARTDEVSQMGMLSQKQADEADLDLADAADELQPALPQHRSR